MKMFEYVVVDATGIHARPASLIVKEVKNYQSKVTIQKGKREAEASKLMGLMAMGVKGGDKIIVKVDGADEETAAKQFKDFLKNNL